MTSFIGQLESVWRVFDQSLDPELDVVVVDHALFHSKNSAVEIHFETDHFYMFAVFWAV